MERGLGLEEDAGARRAFQRAVSMAERDGAELHLLLISSGDSFNESRSADGGMMVSDQGGSNAGGLIRRLTERAGEEGVRTVARTCEGDPTYEILQYVHGNDIDCVVMDSDDGTDDVVCGSLRRAGIDVVTV